MNGVVSGAELLLGDEDGTHLSFDFPLVKPY